MQKNYNEVFVINNIVFLTNNTQTPPQDGLKKVVYGLKRKVPDDCHGYLRFYEEAIIHGQAAADMMIRLQNSGFKPDVIVGHSWVASMFAKEVFPDTPYIAYIEWYYNYKNSDFDFANKNLDINDKAKLICKNSHILQDLVRCDMGLCPTNWQKQQIPEIFRKKIKVIHEGINTDVCKPDKNAEFKVPDSDIVLTRKDKVLTYATRGMEEYRGFPEFMKAASILMKKIPDLHVVVSGEDRVCYGRRIANSTFKKEMLKRYNYDMKRLHFTGPLPYLEYIKLLQVSSAHIYLTYPFVLSWSMMEAMATGCVIIASDTEPVREVMNQDNGILIDFYDTQALVDKAIDVISNKEKYEKISQNARKTIVYKYKLTSMISKQLNLINSVIKK